MASIETIATSCEENVRSAPLPFMGGALAAGFVLSRLPLLALTGLLIRVVFALVRPAILVLGAMKAYDLVREQRKRGDESVAREYS